MSKESYTLIVEEVEKLKADIEKFYDKGVDSAGTRLRKGLRAIENIIRNEKSEILSVRTTRKDAE